MSARASSTTPNGWILTNRHVVTGADTLTVELKDGRQFEGRVYGIDTLTDLAIVKVDATGLPVATLGKSDGLKIGQLVVAIGSPLGTYCFSVTSGIVSGKGRDISVDNGTRINNLIQTDAAINPGNSGGPLADATGAVVGINTAVATDSSGIGFAIPIDIAKPIMAQAIKGEALSRPWIGIRFQTINLQAQKDLKPARGQRRPRDEQRRHRPGGHGGSPAAKAGLQDGDIITAINGIAVDGEHPLDALLVQFAPGDTVTLDVLRDGTHHQAPAHARDAARQPLDAARGGCPPARDHARAARPGPGRRARASRRPGRRASAGSAAADLHARGPQRAAQLDLRLADPDRDLVGGELREELVRDGLGQRLEEVEPRRLHDLAAGVEHRAVVDGLLRGRPRGRPAAG